MEARKQKLCFVQQIMMSGEILDHKQNFAQHSWNKKCWWNVGQHRVQKIPTLPPPPRFCKMAHWFPSRISAEPESIFSQLFFYKHCTPHILFGNPAWHNGKPLSSITCRRRCKCRGTQSKTIYSRTVHKERKNAFRQIYDWFSSSLL